MLSWAVSSVVEQGTHNSLAAGSFPARPTKFLVSVLQCPGGVMAATLVLGTSAARRVGSSPTLGTKKLYRRG